MKYIFDNGNKILVGEHTLGQRNEYVELQTKEYLLAHPEVKLRYAKRQARLRWARKVKSSKV